MPPSEHKTERFRRVFDVPFSFDERPIPVPAELRPVWRVPMLLLIISHCRAQQATWQQLHLLNWAVRSQRSRRIVISIIAGHESIDRAIVRYEPSLARAVDLAVGVGLAFWEKGRALKLSEEGKALVKQIEEIDGVFIEEREFLARVGSKITQNFVARLLEWRLK